MPLVKDMVPPRHTASSVNSDHFYEMSEEEQDFLRELAQSLIEMLEDTERALAKKLNDQLFDIEEGCALWSLLPSKVRSAIKRGENDLRSRR